MRSHKIFLSANEKPLNVRSTNEKLLNDISSNEKPLNLSFDQSQVSGLFTASFALGNFCGPTLSGIIYDQAGFSYNCLVLQFLVAIVLVLNIICYFVPEGEPEYEAIPDTPTAGLSGLDRRDSVFPELPADVIRSGLLSFTVHMFTL